MDDVVAAPFVIVVGTLEVAVVHFCHLVLSFVFHSLLFLPAVVGIQRGFGLLASLLVQILTLLVVSDFGVDGIEGHGGSRHLLHVVHYWFDFFGPFGVDIHREGRQVGVVEGAVVDFGVFGAEVGEFVKSGIVALTYFLPTFYIDGGLLLAFRRFLVAFLVLGHDVGAASHQQADEYEAEDFFHFSYLYL